MFKTKTGALATVAAICGALLLAGCGNGTGTGSPQAGPVHDPTAKLDGVNLTYWVSTGEAHRAQGVVDAFQKATGAHIDLEVVPVPYESNVPTRLASGDKPDLLGWQPSKSVLPVLQPAQKLQVLDDEPWVKDLHSGLGDVGALDGHRYAALVGAPAVNGVYYNKQVFEQAGVTSMPQNYDELLKLARTIKDKVPGVAPFFEVGGDAWPLQWQVQVQMSDLGDKFYDALNKGQAKWTDPRVVAAIQRYKDDVIDAGLAQSDYKTAKFAAQAKDLLAGKAAMAVNITNLVTQMLATTDTATIDKTIGWFPVGESDAKPQYTPTGDMGLVAPKTGDATREAAARQFMAFWLGPDYQKYITDNHEVSIMKSVPSSPAVPKIAQQQLDALPNSVGLLQVKAASSPDIHLYLAAMLNGQKTPEQVAEAMQAQFEQAVKAQGAQK